MFRKLSSSWELVKASWRVLVADKELILFPIIALITSVIVMITFIVPSILAGLFEASGFPIIGYIIGFFFYLAMYTVSIFFNAALVGAAHIRLKGGDPTLGDGFRIAFSHIGNILGYAAISATVGIILRTISERGGIIGKIVSSLVGFAWSVATFLVVPVLVIEEVGPIDAVKRSGRLLKETWGEQLVGNLSIGFIFGWLAFAVIAIGIVFSILFAAIELPVLIIPVVVIGVFALVALSMTSSALSGVYTAAVYQYATTGDTAGYFDADLIEHTFKHK